MNRFSIVTLCVLLVLLVGCYPNAPVQSVSGTKMVVAGKVDTGKNGLTVEQDNITQRIKMDNKPGAIKHLYVISAYSGQVIIYSTVKGKVTSSGKRLTVNKVNGTPPNTTYGLPGVDVGGRVYTTDELLGEDGTVGTGHTQYHWSKIWEQKNFTFL